MEQAELQRTQGGSPVQGWLRARAREREGTPPGTCESFPPGAGLRASEWSLCAQGRWKGTRVTHWNFQPSPGLVEWRYLDIQGAAFEVSGFGRRGVNPALLGRSLGKQRGILLGDPSGPLMFLWVGEGRRGVPRLLGPSPMPPACPTSDGSPICHALRACRVGDWHRALGWHIFALGNASPVCSQALRTASPAQTR